MKPVLEWDALARGHAILAAIPLSLRQAALQCPAARGAVLFRRGARPKYVLYVLSGEIRLSRHTAEGQPVILQRRSGGFIAEASMESKTYHCDIVAAEDSELLLFPSAAFRHALDDNSAFRAVWLSALAREIRRLRAQNERLHLHKASDRVLHYIEAEGQDGVVTLTQTRKAWAAELGISHEVLYRTLARLESSGALSVAGKTLTRTG